MSLDGRELRELREAIGLHRQAFAELLGVTGFGSVGVRALERAVSSRP